MNNVASKQVIYKDQSTGELCIANVTDQTASEAAKRIGKPDGMYLDGSYIRGYDIMKIQEKEKPLGIGAGSADGRYCTKCENGWHIRKNGATPCSCTPANGQIVSDYKAYLTTQAWYTNR